MLIYVDKDGLIVFNDPCKKIRRRVHYYKVQLDVGTIIDFAPETDPISLIHDRYAIAGKTCERKIGHVPKFMFVFYFLRLGGTVSGRVIGGQEYSYDLAQDGLQIPVKYSFEGPASTVKVSRTNVLTYRRLYILSLGTSSVRIRLYF